MEPIPTLSRLIAHLSATPVHDLWFPYPQFAVIHAMRVSVVWASLTLKRQQQQQRKRRGQRNSFVRDGDKDEEEVGLGVMGDLVGYLVMSCESWRTLQHIT